eukprot:TRINITY_DN36936_c0_g1_i1.p1 TRINITY_DN36936_c0_g1~~TRINITY_DN36936_c0_g1_i1.p1  ORF type:complete len:100 (-),score=12.24 TRINITY_DN36936_c0_g1_i1:42-341(-)
MVEYLDQKDARCNNICMEEIARTQTNTQRSGANVSKATDKNDTFLRRHFTQKFIERNHEKVNVRNQVSRPNQKIFPVTPIISSATNIRDFYISQLSRMG